MTVDDVTTRLVNSALTRRRFLERTAVVGGSLAAGNILAACGDDDDDGDGDAPTGQQLGQQLRDILGEPRNLIAEGPGNFDITGSWPLTGPGSVYGELQSEGFRYGAEHVAAWTNGKLRFQAEAVDNAGGDPQKSVANARGAGLAREPIFVTSYIFGFGAQPALIAQYKMLSLDPGGGTGPLAQGLPYCYGFRASYPQDLVDGLLETITRENSDASTLAVVDAEINADYNGANEEFSRGAAQRAGLELVSFSTAPLGQTDYASVISAVKEDDPNVVVFLNFGTDVAYCAREVQRQALDATYGGIDFTPDGAQVAGPAFRDWIFSHDYINVTDPPSDWSKLFVDSWESDNGNPPENYNAAYYASAFAYAIMMDRILGFGGDIQNGADWLRALEQEPTFPHVYGGNGSQIGEIVLDPETHSPTSIPILGFRAEGTGSTEDITLLAEYDIGGRNYQPIES
jgi:ABC-type branched-subunit amino acid transport system substrate-binding protein